jgi:hypothetical protein
VEDLSSRFPAQSASEKVLRAVAPVFEIWIPRKMVFFQVTHETFCCSPVVLRWFVHELGEFVDSKTNIRTCKREILKTPNNVAKLRAIRGCCAVLQLKWLASGEWSGDVFSTHHIYMR